MERHTQKAIGKTVAELTHALCRASVALRMKAGNWMATPRPREPHPGEERG